MVETRSIKLLSMFILISGLLSSCDQVAASSKIVLNGTSTKTPFLQKSTYTPTKEPPPTHTASLTASITATYTETATLTDTIEILDTDTALPPSLTSSLATATSIPSKPGGADTPTVKVSITTNCRTGPGISYPKLSPLTAGKTASLIGKDKTTSYWIIKDPGKTGRDCWLWGYYATATGNTQDLKVYSSTGSTNCKIKQYSCPNTPENHPGSHKNTPKHRYTENSPSHQYAKFDSGYLYIHAFTANNNTHSEPDTNSE